MMNGFTFNGTSTQSLGLLVTALNPYNSATRKVDKFTIPYRNGDLIIDSGTYENIRVGYEISVIRNTKATCDAINEWLSGSQGYCILTDTYNPEIFRVGYMADSIEYVLTALYREGRSTIEFDCLPQKYLVSNQPMTFSSTADTTTDTTMSLSTVPTPIDISLNGNTTQEGSSGKNLFGFIASDFTGAYGSANYVEITGLTEGTYYTCSSNAPTGYIWFGKNANASQGTINFNRVYQGNPITVQVDSMKKITVGILASDKTTALSYKTQIEKGSTATSYEPHISPTFPQVIHNVSGDNKVVIASKNLLSNDWENDWQRGYWDISTGKFVSSRNWQAIKYYIPVQPNTTYYVYADPNISASIGNICQYDANKNFVIYKAGTKNTTFTTSANVYFLTIYVGNPYKGTNISLSKSDTTTNGTYVPFTNQSYPLYLPVENLLDNDLLLVSNWTKSGDVYSGNLMYLYNAYGTNTNGIYNTFKANTQYSFSLDLKADATTRGLLARFVYTDSTNSQVTCQNANTTDFVHYTLTSESGKSISKLIFSYANGMTVNIKNMQLEKGTNASQYNPYGSPYIELNKIGTYQDYIYKNGGKWYVHKETASVDMGTLTYQTDNGGVYFYSSVSGKGRTNFDLLCTCYTVTTSTNTSGMTDYQVKGQTSGSYIFVKDSRYTSPTDLKTALSGETLKYNLATATNTEITDTTLVNQLNNIEKAYSYNGTTNILQVSNDNGFMLEVVSLHGSTFASNYRGEPVITVNQTGLIYLNGVAINVTQAPMTINSQTMQCYNGTVNLNNYAEMDDFPMIKKGDNTVGSSMSISVVPNYWKL